jgi:1-acyl-sn-glycerol-3-phosphate acyltransferase
MEKWRLEPARDLGVPLGKSLSSLQRESGLVSVIARLGWWSAVRAYLALCHRLSIRGREHLPAAPPFVIVANHASHLDALVLAAAVPRRLWDRVFPIAAGDTFFQTPLLAAFAAVLLNALPMWRRHCGAHALRELRSRLTAEPCTYILFPEGTRSRDGRMASFRSGLGMIVAATDVPVVPAYVEGAFGALRPGRRLPRLRRIRVRMGPPLRFAGATNDRAGWNEISRCAEAAVRGLAEAAGGRSAVAVQ